MRGGHRRDARRVRMARRGATVGGRAAQVRELLSPQYFRLFCQKFAGEFLPGFYETVCSAKRINEMGTHQLLLDLVFDIC